FLDLRSSAGSSKVTIVYVSLLKRLTMAKIMIRLGDEHNALIEARRGMAKAQRFDLTQLALEFAILLRGFCYKSGDLLGYEKYDTIVKDLRLRYNAELETAEALERFGIHYKRRISYKSGTREILKQSLTIVENILQRTESHPIWMTYYKLKIYDHDMNGEYNAVYDIADKAINYLDSTSAAARANYGTFYLQQMGSCIYTRNRDKGIAAYLKAVEYIQSGNANWFTLKEFAFIFFMHINEIAKAEEIYLEATTNKAFPQLDQIQKQRWNILKLYELFAKDELKRSVSKRTKEGKELRSLITSAGDLQQDKEGFGFDVRLMHILYLVECGEYSKLTEHIDSFKKYCIRYFTPEQYPKSRAFASLLILLERYSYNADLILKKSVERYNNLISTKISFIEASENVQVVPYEILWEKIVSKLHSDTDKVRKFNERKQRKVMATAPRLKRAAAVTDFSRTAA
ncbi:MAG TPA: hypothetical protein VFO76_09285, partial [Candidatus Kapabacteria bacterium]|nr:hypothetical protein [Candidatus Kapabacteria bacterium]